MERSGNVHTVVVRGEEGCARPASAEGMRHAEAFAGSDVLTRDTQAILDEAEELLEKWKHPDPYRHPTAPGGLYHVDTICASHLRVAGSKFERNLPSPLLNREYDPSFS